MTYKEKTLAIAQRAQTHFGLENGRIRPVVGEELTHSYIREHLARHNNDIFVGLDFYSWMKKKVVLYSVELYCPPNQYWVMVEKIFKIPSDVLYAVSFYEGVISLTLDYKDNMTWGNDYEKMTA